MNLQSIIVASLSLLGRNTDSDTVKDHTPRMTFWANEAVREISDKFKQSKLDVVTLTDSKFATSQLTSECIKVNRVMDGSTRVKFNQDVDGSGTFVCETTASSVNVTYEYAPAVLVNLVDVPDLPERLHSLIPYYVVACERVGAGDGDTQSAASPYFSLFNDKLARLVKSSHRGEPDSYKLIGY